LLTSTQSFENFYLTLSVSLEVTIPLNHLGMLSNLPSMMFAHRYLKALPSHDPKEEKQCLPMLWQCFQAGL